MPVAPETAPALAKASALLAHLTSAARLEIATAAPKLGNAATAVIAGVEVHVPGVVDVAAEVWDGKDHPVDSSEAAFKMASDRAFREAFQKARPVLLEPVMRLQIVIPSKFMGDITGDLNKRRGRIQGMDSRGNLQVIEALAPLAEIANYSTELRSITGGEGSFSMTHDHYDSVPGHIAEGIIARAAKDRHPEDED